MLPRTQVFKESLSTPSFHTVKITYARTRLGESKKQGSETSSILARSFERKEKRKKAKLGIIIKKRKERKAPHFQERARRAPPILSIVRGVACFSHSPRQISFVSVVGRSSYSISRACAEYASSVVDFLVFPFHLNQKFFWMCVSRNCPRL